MKFLNPAHTDGDRHGLSAGVVVDDLVFADASAIDLATGQVVAEASTVAEETRVCLDRLDLTLREAGLSLSDLVKVNCYLSDDDDRADFWAAIDERLAPGPYPVRITQVTDLGSARVLLDAVASSIG